VVVRAGVVLAKPSVNKGVIGGLVVNPKEKELSWLEARLKFEVDDLKGDCLCR
jgi:hypothetical protein